MCYSALVEQDLDALRRKYGELFALEFMENFKEATRKIPSGQTALEERIFPGSYAPVIFEKNGKWEVLPMRYGAYPPPFIPDPERYTTFNARRDNLLSSFWSEAYLRHHGFVVLKGFFEWVAVKDLLRAGVVTLEQVKAEFQQQMAARKAKILASGKKYKPTATELKDAVFRQIIIQFQPEQSVEMLVPVIFSEKQMAEGWIDRGFAIVTDEPPPEIRAAGHDRCPIILQAEAVKNWIGCQPRSAQRMNDILGQKQTLTFRHFLPLAA